MGATGWGGGGDEGWGRGGRKTGRLVNGVAEGFPRGDGPLGGLDVID